jgi:hypothetical protein
MPVDFASKVLTVLSEHGTVTRIQRIENAPESGYHVYAVFNGPDVLQIGHGRDGRMRSCMRGALAKRHNKAFICALGEKVLGRRNEYAFIEVDSKEQAEQIEEHVHTQFGIRTNDDAACLISGLTDVGPVSVERVNRWLWQKVVVLSAYRNLSPSRKVMAEELMDLVTWCTVRERGPERNRLTAQGDLLEGHTLAKLNKAHLIHIFQELTDDYLRYGSHKLTDEEFRARERGYQYVPRSERFEIVLDGERHAEEAMERPVRRRGTMPPAHVAADAHGARSDRATDTPAGELVERLSDDHYGPFDSDICGNDESNRENSQKLKDQKLGSPFILRLHWKKSKAHLPRWVGCYRLNLRGLLDGGYMYRDPDGAPRLKIQHDGGAFYIRRTVKGPAVRLG